MDLDAREPATEMRREATEPAQLLPPEPMRQTMDPDRMQPRIAGENLPFRARRSVALEDAGDVALQSREYALILELPE